MDLKTPKEAVRKAYRLYRRSELSVDTSEPWHFVLSEVFDRRHTERYVETVCGIHLTEVLSATFDAGYHDTLIHGDTNVLAETAPICEQCLRPYK